LYPFLIPPQLAQLPPQSFTPNSITVILSTTTYLSLRVPASNRLPAYSRLRTLLPMLLLKLLILSHHSYLTLSSLVKITECIEYKLLSLTYKVPTTTHPPYLHNLISVQPPLSTSASSLVTRARPPTSSLLRITDRSFRYASPCLWNQLPIVLSVNLISVLLSLTCLFMLLPHLNTLLTHHSQHS